MTADVHDLLAHRLHAADYRTWRAQVQATRGCAAPIRLRGSRQVLDRDGAMLIESSGDVLAPCGNRRATVCPACSDRYAADAYHLLRAGLAGDTTKNVPASVVEHPRAFVTLTAPSFGPVHTRRVTPRGRIVPCGCGELHRSTDDPRPGTALDPESYDYDGAVLWQAHTGRLWDRFTTALRRRLAALLGIRVREFADHARLSYAKVAEYQRRGLVHFHAVIRLDGPAGPADLPPHGLDEHALRDAVRYAARTATVTTTSPDTTPLELRWGAQVDVRPVTSSAARQLEDADTGAITDAALAAYIAKYATKGTGAIEGTDRPIHDGEHIEHLPDLTPHHRQMIHTAWRLGGTARRWAHMLGFPGHFLTKSRRYSTTFAAMRAVRRAWRLRHDLDQLAAATLGPDGTPDPHNVAVDPDTVTVVNDWTPIRFGHRDDTERELAAAIAERHRTQRRTASRQWRSAS